MYRRPVDLFDRLWEWDALGRFVGGGVGATLGLVYGRRRQGKTLLLQSLCEVTGGLLISGLQQSSAQNLAAFGAAYSRFAGLPAPVALADWATAVDLLFKLGEGRAGPLP